MTGRLLGEVSLPPEDASCWSLAAGTIYGCPLCHLLNNRTSTAKLYILQDDLRVVNATVYPSRHHSSVIAADDIDMTTSRPVAVCTTLGHVYLKEVGTIPWGRRPTVLTATTLAVSSFDLPEGHLYYFRGRFYNLDAPISDASHRQTSELERQHSELEQLRSEHLAYHTQRRVYLTTLVGYLLPTGVNLDTSYGLLTFGQLFKPLVVNNPDIQLRPFSLQRIQGQVRPQNPNRSIIYYATLRRWKLFYKYLDLNTANSMRRYSLVRANAQRVNDNLEHHPNLPYPYLIESARCRLITDVNQLTAPTCSPAAVGREYAMLVTNYLDHIGTVGQLIARFEVPLYVETVATLAEAHQGSTVKHHFMHLDAHGHNFLVHRSEKESSRRYRFTDLGGLKYKFGSFNFRVYLIDFAYSHFIDDGNRRTDHKGYVPADVLLADTVYPAYDLISLNKTVVPKLVVSSLRTAWGYHDTSELIAYDDYTERRWYNCVKLLKISACVLSDHITTMCARARLLDESKRQQSSVDVMDLESLVAYVGQHYQQPRARVQNVLLDLIDALTEELTNLDRVEMAHDNLYELVRVFAGSVSAYRGADHRYYAELVDKTYYQQFITPLDPTILERLGITGSPPKQLTGLALYLWYLQASGVIKLPTPSILETDVWGRAIAGASTSGVSRGVVELIEQINDADVEVTRASNT